MNTLRFSLLPIPKFFFLNGCHPYKHRHNFSVSVNASPRPFRVILMAPSETIVAEYAKSNRSTCKACSKAIESKTLRLGLVSKDKRGYNVTKWHHLSCFPLPSSHSTSDIITGFSSLKVLSFLFSFLLKSCCLGYFLFRTKRLRCREGKWMKCIST